MDWPALTGACADDTRRAGTDSTKSRKDTCWDRDNISQLQVPDGEVDNGGVLLPEEVVLGEALHVQHQVGRQPRQPVPPPPGFDVIVDARAVKFAQQLKDGHLRRHTRPHLSALVNMLSPALLTPAQTGTSMTLSATCKATAK